MWTCCINRHVLLGVCALARTCLHTAGLVYAYGHIFVVFSRCNAAGRIYMASKTGSYYQYPLTRVCFSVHLHVYSPVNKEAKFILWPLYATAFQRQLGLDSNSVNMSFTACKLCPPYCLFCFGIDFLSPFLLCVVSRTVAATEDTDILLFVHVCFFFKADCYMFNNFEAMTF